MWASWFFQYLGGGLRVWPHRRCRSPHCLVLTVHPQAELATSQKCLSQEVKRLTEENQGLRAEQPPSSAPRGLEQDEGGEESLPSSLPVRGVRALPFHPQQNTGLGPWDSGPDPACCISCITTVNSCGFAKTQFPPLQNGTTTPPSIGTERKGVHRALDMKRGFPGGSDGKESAGSAGRLQFMESQRVRHD